MDIASKFVSHGGKLLYFPMLQAHFLHIIQNKFLNGFTRGNISQEQNYKPNIRIQIMDRINHALIGGHKNVKINDHAYFLQRLFCPVDVRKVVSDSKSNRNFLSDLLISVSMLLT